MRASFVAAGLIAAVGLSACNDAGGHRTNARVCLPFTTAAAASSDPSAVVDDCLHRWAYSLAASRDEAEQVARATVAACSPSLTRWNQQSLTPEGGAAQEGASLLTGQTTTPIAEHLSYAQGRALLYVVQARAGNCAPPATPAGAPAAGTP